MNSVEYNSDLLQQKDPLILLKSIVVSNPDIMLKQGEKLLYCKKAKRRTVTNRVTGSKTVGGGGRVHLFKGVSISTGTSERKSIREDVVETFEGTLYITTKRVIFLSQTKGFEVPLSKLTKLERNKDNKVSVNIYEGQKYYEIVTNEGDSARIALIYRLLSVLINDGRVNLL